MDMVGEMKTALESTLNSTALSADSIYGILILLVIGYLVIHGVKSVTNSIGSIIGFILLLEVGHVCAFSTTLGTQLPFLQTLFKYDVLTALAQLCVGTQIASFLLYVQAWLNAVMQQVVDTVGEIAKFAMRYIESTGVLESMRNDRYYKDMWRGSEAVLDREYRGHILTIRECAALFRGCRIEIHGLKRGHTEYSIQCELVSDPHLPGVVHVRSGGTVGQNPDYCLDRETSPFRPHGLQEDAVELSDEGDVSLDLSTQAALMSETDDGNQLMPYIIRPDGYDPELKKKRAMLAGLIETSAGSWRAAFGIM